MKANEVNGSSRDGEANVTLLRKIADEFPATVSWSASNGSAIYKTHYTLNQGLNIYNYTAYISFNYQLNFTILTTSLIKVNNC